jgi:hypothetical protein
MWRTLGIAFAIGLSVTSSALFVAFAVAQNGPQKEPEPTAEEKEAQAAMAAVMSDKRLLSIHREFVTRAEKLALEYEKDKDWAKAKTVWGEVLKIAPTYGPARLKMQQLLEREANADVVRMDVQAGAAWQDTGVIVVPGKPVRIRAAGYRHRPVQGLRPVRFHLPQERPRARRVGRECARLSPGPAD